jgi:hypothetical protein
MKLLKIMAVLICVALIVMLAVHFGTGDLKTLGYSQVEFILDPDTGSRSEIKCSADSVYGTGVEAEEFCMIENPSPQNKVLRIYKLNESMELWHHLANVRYQAKLIGGRYRVECLSLPDSTRTSSRLLFVDNDS